MKRLLRTMLLAGIAALAISAAGGGLWASGASASGHCPGGYDGCAWANADYSGGFYHWPNNQEYFVHSFTGLASKEGCTTGSFNDCVSSIDNEGPWTLYYYKNAGCTGETYVNEAYTGTNYVGSFWNDSFSSLSELYNEPC